MSAESSKIDYPQVQINPDICTKLQIPLLKNSANLCWFDAGNFALFHKQRPELDAFFEKYKTEEGLEELNKLFVYKKNITFKKEDIELLENIYNHFNGTNIKTNGYLRSLINEFRNNPNFPNFLEKKTVSNESFSIKQIIKESVKTDPNSYKLEKKAFKREYREKTNDENKKVEIKDFDQITFNFLKNTKDSNLDYIENINRTYKFEKINNEYICKIAISIKRENSSISDEDYFFKLTEEEVEEYFDRKGGEITIDFSISQGNQNDTGEYFTALLKLPIFENGIQIKKVKEKNIIKNQQNKLESFFSDSSPEKLKFFDLILDFQFSFNEYIEDTLKRADFQTKKLNTNTYTLVIEVGRFKDNNGNYIYKNFDFLETLVIPLEDINNSNNIVKGEFKLDAIVIQTSKETNPKKIGGSGHYFVVFKCEKTGKWYYYNDTEVRDNQTLEEYFKNPIDNSIKQEYNSFEEILNAQVSMGKNIPNQGAKVLIYSREKTENNK